MKQELKACPFCGGRANYRTKYSRRKDIYFVSIICTECGAQGRSFRSFVDPVGTDVEASRKAAQAWNERPGEPNKADVLESE